MVCLSRKGKGVPTQGACHVIARRSCSPLLGGCGLTKMVRAERVGKSHSVLDGESLRVPLPVASAGNVSLGPRAQRMHLEGRPTTQQGWSHSLIPAKGGSHSLIPAQSGLMVTDGGCHLVEAPCVCPQVVPTFVCAKVVGCVKGR